MNDLPSNVYNKLNVMQNFSKQPIKVQAVTGATVNAGGYTTFQLPVGSVLDLRSIALHFFGRNTINGADCTAANIVALPQHTLCLIRTLSINCNGVNLTNIPYYGWLYTLLIDFKTSYNSKMKQMGTNPDPSLYLDMTDAGVVSKYPTYKQTTNTNINSFKRNYQINDWIGFLGSCEPSITDTNILGQVEIVIQWESTDVLWVTPTVTGYNYELSLLELWVNKIDFKDDRYLLFNNNY